MNNQKLTDNSALYPSLTVEEAAKFLLVPAKTLIFTHRTPDADALGSAFGLKFLLEAAGGTARVACTDEASSRLSFLTFDQGSLQINGFEFDRIVSVDTGSRNQLGSLVTYVDAVALSIDHHGTAQVYCPYCVDSTAPSASMIIYEIAKLSGLELPREFYIAIYAAVSGDTGCFKYSNVLPKTHLAAAELLEKIDVKDENGETVMPDASEINRRIYDSHTPSELMAMQLVLSKLDVYCDGTLSVVMLTAADMEQFGLNDRDLADAAGLVRSVEGASIGIFARQIPDTPNKFRVSARANVEVDVSAVCAQYNGGGHKRASGCTIRAASPEAAIDVIIDAFGPIALAGRV